MLRALSACTLLALHGCAAAQSVNAPAGRHDVIRAYSLRLEPDLEVRSIRGEVDLLLDTPGPTLELNKGELTIERVVELGQPLAFTSGERLRIELPARSAAQRTVTISYRGEPKRGLFFDFDTRQMHTAFATSEWMPCIDNPSVRALFSLTITLAAGQQLAVSTAARPMPSYLYGFAAGPFVETHLQAGAVDLRLLGTPSFEPGQLRKVFEQTAAMIAFYEWRSGVKYPDSTYTQVLLKGSAAQELSGIALLGEKYGLRVLADPTAVWLGTHELSHTWWGNGVTNCAFTDFWLNEGIASFMNAAWFEHSQGKAAYDGLIEAARRKLEQQPDRPLVFKEWKSPTAADRSIVYDKGAYVMHLLRLELGEDAFWRALSDYTKESWGRCVLTEDFRRVFERSARRDLSAFFKRWVE